MTNVHISLLRLINRAQRQSVEALEQRWRPDELTALEAARDLISRKDGRWELTPAGRRATRNFAGVNAAAAYRLIKNIAGLSHEDVAAALAADGVDVPLNRVRAWSRHPADRRACRMSWDELMAVLWALADHLPPFEDEG